MNILKPTTKAQTDVEKWQARIKALQAECGQTERAAAAALQAVSAALVDGVDDQAASAEVTRLELRSRALGQAITEAQHRLEAAKEAEKAKRAEQAKAQDAKLGAALRAAHIGRGRALAAELAAAQAVADAHRAYTVNRQGLELSTTEASAALGQPDVSHISAAARALEYVLGPDDYARTGLPPFAKISLEK